MSAVPDADAAAPAGVPGDKVQLTVLLVSGKRHPFLFNPKDTIEQVKAHVAANWPTGALRRSTRGSFSRRGETPQPARLRAETSEWADETPASAASLRVVHLGRFLADNSTLEGNKIPAGVNTIVHMTIKEPTPGDAQGAKLTARVA
ncbi:MAG: hypothetical protein BJ554DRAFT_5944, partial [Olpidium bornovanus]